MKKLELIKLSTIRARIAILIFIQIVFIIISFIILSYYQSQVIYLENSINIADKNRFLTANLMFKISEYILEGSNDVSKINSAINQLESNILILGHNGKISGIPLALGSPRLFGGLECNLPEMGFTKINPNQQYYQTQ